MAVAAAAPGSEVVEEVAPPGTPTAAEAAAGSEGFKQTKQKLHASKTATSSICNSAELRQLIDSLIVDNDANESKRRIHKTANKQFVTQGSDRGIDVICAPGPFSYRIAVRFGERENWPNNGFLIIFRLIFTVSTRGQAPILPALFFNNNLEHFIGWDKYRT